MKNTILGYIFVLTACFFGVLTGFIVKWMDNEIPVLQILFIRFTVGFFVMLPVILKKEGSFKIPKSAKSNHLWRSILGLLSVLLCYYAIPKIKFSDYVVLGHVYPILMIIFSFFFLKEKLKLNKTIAAILAVVGAAVAVRPDLDSPVLYLGILLIGVCIAALSDIFVKKLTTQESCVKIICCFFGISMLILSFCMPFVWVNPSNLNVVILILMISVLGLASQYFITKGYQLLNAGTIGVLTSSKLILGMVLGAMVWGEQIGLHSLVGMGIIFLSSFIIPHIKFDSVINIFKGIINIRFGKTKKSMVYASISQRMINVKVPAYTDIRSMNNFNNKKTF